jgi:hypothetical protein
MTSSDGSPIKRNGRMIERKIPPECKRCPREKAVDLSEENEEIYRLYLLSSRCGCREETSEDTKYLFSVIADVEAQTQKTIMESAIISALAKVM